MTKKTVKWDLDMIGASASMLCALHCAIVPLILTFGLLSGMSFMTNPVWEFLFIGSSVLIAGISLINGYSKHHQSWAPIVTALIGFAIIGIGHFVISGAIGHWLAALGGLTVAASHVLNFRACKTCKTCRD